MTSTTAVAESCRKTIFYSLRTFLLPPSLSSKYHIHFCLYTHTTNTYVQKT